MTLAPEAQPGVAAGVPFLVVPPGSASRDRAPVVVAWHLMSPPRAEAAFAAAVPMAGLEAWRVYLGLPLSGSRLPAGGLEELGRLGYEDAVLKLHGPVVLQAASEFPAALAELHDRFGFRPGPLGLVGGSEGAAVAQLVMTETAPAAGLAVAAAVLVSPVTQMRALVDALAQHFAFAYPWTDESSAVAHRLDFVGRADDFVAGGQPAVRLIVGSEDDRDAVQAPAEQLRDALRRRYDDRSRVDLVTVPGMAHALADEPGLEPAPQTPHAAIVDRLTVDWMRRHLLGEA